MEQIRESVGKVMTENCLSDRPGYGRTFRTAMGVIGVIASIQVLAMGFGVLRRAPATTAGGTALAPLQMPPVAPLSAPVQNEARDPAGPVHPLAVSGPGDVTVPPPGGADAMNQVVPDFSPTQLAVPVTPPLGANLGGALRSASFPNAVDLQSVPPALPGPSFGAPAAVAESPSLSAALAVAARESPLEGEPILERLMATGAELRASGNMQGALKAFREVETALPDHPRILSELAATLSQMGLSDKANGYWERVEGAGPVVAGAYFPLAGQQLRGEIPTAPDASAKVMKIGEVKVEERAPTSEGQMVTLRVVVDADPNARPIGDDLTLLVYFYDRITGGEVKASTADTSYDYPSAPYDWQADGTEEIVVKYNQPIFTEEQKRELGERSYHGYAIELYYRDQIQDKVAKPDDIARLRLEAPAEPAAAGGFLGPENALFPNSVYP